MLQCHAYITYKRIGQQLMANILFYCLLLYCSARYKINSYAIYALVNAKLYQIHNMLNNKATLHLRQIRYPELHFHIAHTFYMIAKTSNLQIMDHQIFWYLD